MVSRRRAYCGCHEFSSWLTYREAPLLLPSQIFTIKTAWVVTDANYDWGRASSR
jgi:hypothetical protein